MFEALAKFIKVAKQEATLRKMEQVGSNHPMYKQQIQNAPFKAPETATGRFNLVDRVQQPKEEPKAQPVLQGATKPLPTNYRQAIHEESKDIRFTDQLANIAKRAWIGGVAQTEAITDTFSNIQHMGLAGAKAVANKAPDAVNKMAQAFGVKTVDNDEDLKEFNRSVDAEMERLFEKTMDDPYVQDQWEQYYEWRENKKISATSDFVGDAMASSLAMVPQMAMGALTGGSSLGFTYMGTRVFNTAYQEAISDGAKTDDASVYGLTMAGLEVGLETLSGGIPFVGGGWLSDIATKLLKNPETKTFMKMAINLYGEGLEEYLAETFGAVAQKIYKDTGKGILQTLGETAVSKEAFLAGLSGMISAGVTQMGHYATAMSAKGIVQSNLRRIASEPIQTQYNYIQEFGRRNDIQVEFKDFGNTAQNAMWVDGKIVINTQAKAPVLALLAHEVAHDMEFVTTIKDGQQTRVYSNAYKKAQQALFSMFPKTEIDRMTNERLQIYQAYYNDLAQQTGEPPRQATVDEARRELFAKLLEEHFTTNLDSIRRLIKQHPTVADRIHMALQEYAVTVSEIEYGALKNARHIERIYAEMLAGHRIEQDALNLEFGMRRRFDETLPADQPEISPMAEMAPTQASMQSINESLTQRIYGTLEPSETELDPQEQALKGFGDVLFERGINVQYSLDEVDRKQMRNLSNKEYKLIGVHVSTADKLAESIALGGLVYPSIAVNFVKNPIETFTKHAVFVLRSDALLPTRNDVVMYNKDFVSPTMKPVERIPDEQAIEQQTEALKTKLAEYGNKNTVINNEIALFKGFIADLVNGSYLNERQRAYAWASRPEMRVLSQRIHGTDSVQVASRWLEQVAKAVIKEKTQVIYQDGKIIKRVPYNTESVLEALENTSLMGDKFLIHKLNPYQVLASMNATQIKTFDDLIRTMQYLVNNPTFMRKIERVESTLYELTKTLYNNYSNKQMPFGQFMDKFRNGLLVVFEQGTPNEQDLRRYLTKNMGLNPVLHQKQSQSVILDFKAVADEMFSAMTQYVEAKRIGLVPFKDVRAVIIRRDKLLGLKYSKTDTAYANVDIDALANQMAVDLKKAGVETVYYAKTDRDEMEMLKKLDGIDIREHLFDKKESLYSLNEKNKIIEMDPMKYGGFVLTTWESAQKSLPNRLKVEQAIRFMRNNAKADEGNWLSVIDELSKKDPNEIISKDEVLSLIANDPFKLTISEVNPPYFRGYAFGEDNYREHIMVVEAKKLPALDSEDAFRQKLHYTDPNVIAHIRLSDVYSQDGKKNLMLEEVQSDWHQAGIEESKRYDYAKAQEMERLIEKAKAKANYQPIIESAVEAFKRAYTEPVVLARTASDDAVIVKKGNLEDVFDDIAKKHYNGRYVSHTAKSGFGLKTYRVEIRTDRGNQLHDISLETVDPADDLTALISMNITSKTPRGTSVIRAIDDGRFYNSISSQLSEINLNDMLYKEATRDLKDLKDGRVPDAPWSNSWVEMAVRSAVMEAVDKGYDRVVIPTGYETVRRYDPSIRRVSEINVTLNKDNDNITIEIAQGNNTGSFVMADDSTTFTQDSVLEMYRRSGLKDARVPLTAEDAQEIIALYQSMKRRQSRLISAHVPYHGLMYEASLVAYAGKSQLYDQRIPSELRKLGKRFGVAPQKGIFSAVKERQDVTPRIDARLSDVVAEIRNLETLIDDSDPYINQNDMRNKLSAFITALADTAQRVQSAINRMTPRDAFMAMHTTMYNHQGAYLGVGRESNNNNAKLVGMMLAYAYEVKNLVADYKVASKPLSYEPLSQNPIENQHMFDHEADNLRMGNFTYLDITDEMRDAYKGKMPLFSINEFDQHHLGLKSQLYKTIFEKMKATDSVRNVIKLATTNIKTQEYTWLGLKEFLESKDPNEKVSKDEVLAVLHNNNIVLTEDTSSHYTASDYTYGQDGINVLLMMQSPKVVGTFDKSHWASENVVLHYRASKANDINGAPVILLDELQSDWHQRGKKDGYRKPKTALEIPTKNVRQVSMELIEQLKLKLRETNAELRRIAKEKGYVRSIIFMASSESLHNLTPELLKYTFGKEMLHEFDNIESMLEHVEKYVKNNIDGTADKVRDKMRMNDMDWSTFKIEKEPVTISLADGNKNTANKYRLTVTNKRQSHKVELGVYYEHNSPYIEGQSKTAVDSYIDRLKEITSNYSADSGPLSRWSYPKMRPIFEIVENIEANYPLRSVMMNLIDNVRLEIPDFMVADDVRGDWSKTIADHHKEAVKIEKFEDDNEDDAELPPWAPYHDDLWVDLGVRSFLKTAVDEGYNKLYFANGMMNTARYMGEAMPADSIYTKADNLRISAELTYDGGIKFSFYLGTDYDSDWVADFDVPLQDGDNMGILNMKSWQDTNIILENYIENEDYALYTVMTDEKNREAISNAFKDFYEDTIKPLVALTEKNIDKYIQAIDDGDDEEDSVWESMDEMLRKSKSYYAPLQPLVKVEGMGTSTINFEDITRFKGMNMYYDIKIPKILNKLLNRFGVFVGNERGTNKGMDKEEIYKAVTGSTNIVIDNDDELKISRIVSIVMDDFAIRNQPQEYQNQSLEIDEDVVMENLIDRGILDAFTKQKVVNEDTLDDDAITATLRLAQLLAQNIEQANAFYQKNKNLFEYEHVIEPEKSDFYLNHQVRDVQGFYSVTLNKEAIDFIKNDMPLFSLDEEYEFTGMMYALNEYQLSELRLFEHQRHAGFYSAMRRVIAEKMGGSAFVKEIIKIAQTGTKAEEYEFSGLKEYLESKDPNEKLTQQEVLDFLKSNAVTMKEYNSSSYADYSLGRGNRVNKIYEITTPKMLAENTTVNTHWGGTTERALAHYRQSFGTAVKEDGTRISSYIVEEIQSDWHQRGLKHGYIGAEYETLKKQIKETKDKLDNIISDISKTSKLYYRQPLVGSGPTIKVNDDLAYYQNDVTSLINVNSDFAPFDKELPFFNNTTAESWQNAFGEIVPDGAPFNDVTSNDIRVPNDPIEVDDVLYTRSTYYAFIEQAMSDARNHFYRYINFLGGWERYIYDANRYNLSEYYRFITHNPKVRQAVERDYPWLRPYNLVSATMPVTVMEFIEKDKEGDLDYEPYYYIARSGQREVSANGELGISGRLIQDLLRILEQIPWLAKKYLEETDYMGLGVLGAYNRDGYHYDLISTNQFMSTPMFDEAVKFILEESKKGLPYLAVEIKEQDFEQMFYGVIEKQRLENDVSRLRAIANNYSSEKVPDAPLKKTWMEFMVNNAIRNAILSGEERIYFANGAINTSRWGEYGFVKPTHVHIDSGNGTYERIYAVIDYESETISSSGIGNESRVLRLAYHVDENEWYYNSEKLSDKRTEKPTVASKRFIEYLNGEVDDVISTKRAKDITIKDPDSFKAPISNRQNGMTQFYDVQLPQYLRKVAKKYNLELKEGIIYDDPISANKYPLKPYEEPVFNPVTSVKISTVRMYHNMYKEFKKSVSDMYKVYSMDRFTEYRQNFMSRLNVLLSKNMEQMTSMQVDAVQILAGEYLFGIPPRLLFDRDAEAYIQEFERKHVNKPDDYYDHYVKDGKLLYDEGDLYYLSKALSTIKSAVNEFENNRLLETERARDYVGERMELIDRVGYYKDSDKYRIPDEIIDMFKAMPQRLDWEYLQASELLFSDLRDYRDSLRTVIDQIDTKMYRERMDYKNRTQGTQSNIEKILGKIADGTATEMDIMQLKVNKKIINIFPYLELNDEIKDAYTSGWGMPLYSLGMDYEAEFLRQRKHQDTILDSGHMTDEIVDEVAKEIHKGTFTYIQSSNKKIFERAKRLVDYNGFEHMFNVIESKIKTGERMTKEDIAIAEVLIKQGATEKRTTEVLQLIADLALIGTELGQAVQALSLIRKMTPEGQLMTLQRTVGRMNSTYARQGRDIDIAIDLEIAERLFPEDGHTPSQAEITEVMEDIKKDIAEQLPVTWYDKLNAWRYLSMLGNPLTHFRNILGNAIFVPARITKDLIALGIETGAISMGLMKEEQRTKAIMPWHHHSKKGIVVMGDQNSADAERLRFAYRDFMDMQNIIQGSVGKFDIQRDIQMKRTIFKSENRFLKKPMELLEKTREINFNALEAEDLWFMERHYVNSLAMYMKAQNLHGDTITEEQLQTAQNYAIEEARKMTYRDFNAVSNLLTNIEVRGGKFARFAMQSTVPFKKTPLNILRRGLEYSPVGLMKTITAEAYQLSKGNIDAHDFIENISAGLTGTGVLLLGMMLANMGWLSAGGDDDEKKLSAFEYMQGKQKYSLTLPFDMGTYTIDWAVPTVLPFIIGAEIANAVSKERDANLANAIPEAFINIFDPVFELTMLQGVTSTLQSFSGSGAGMVGEAITTMIANYIGQLFPTVGGQLARAFDPYVRNVYAPKDSPYNKVLETIGRKILNKIPFGTYLNEPNIDLRGDVVERVGDNVVTRAMMNMFSVGYYKPENTTKTDEIIMDLYERTKETSVIPRNYPAGNSFTYADSNYILQGKELTEFKKTMGKNQYRFVEDIAKSQEYKQASDEDKIKLITRMYDHAYAIAKNKALAGRKIKYEDPAYEKVVGGAQHRLSVADYHRAKYVYEGLKEITQTVPANAFKGTPAKTKVIKTKKAQVIEQYKKMGFTAEQIKYLMVAIGGYTIDKETEQAIGSKGSIRFK